MSNAAPPPPSDASAPHAAVRVLLLVGGSVALVLGAVGTIIPLLPTTPLILLAAGCYARAWAPAHRWLRANRFFGPICRAGHEGRYLPPRAKLTAVVLTLVSFGVTCFALDAWPLRVLVAALGLGVLVWLLRLPTSPRQTPGAAGPERP